jgi:YaiO family outer membrane protein
MNRFYILLLFFLVSGGLFMPSLSYSQTITDPEAEYLRIRSVAFSGKYDEAIADSRKLLKEYPSYGDARILLGRILAWTKDYKSAIAVIDTLLVTEPGNYDAIQAKNSIMLWAKESSPVSTDIRAGYSFDSWTEPYNRSFQLYKVGAGHRFKFGPAAGYLNMGNLISGNPLEVSTTDFQAELEAWPKLTKKNYAFLSYSFSPGKFFPVHRAAAELWQVLPAGWSVSAGMNYYYFDRNTYIATGSVEKYIRNTWLSLRGFFYFKDDGVTTSVYLNARQYFNDNDYLQLTVGTGTAPDEPFDVQFDLMRLSAHSARLALNVSVAPKLALRLGAGYSYEEYQEGLWRNRWEGGISLTYAIRMK